MVREAQRSRTPPWRQSGKRTSRLCEFRERFPMDDMAFDYLSNVSEDCQSQVLLAFRAVRGHQDDYSASVTKFTTGVKTRLDQEQNETTPTRVHDDYARDSGPWRAQDAKSSGHWRKHGIDYDKKESMQESRLYAFRSKFPMDDKAFDCLFSSSATVQDQVMNDFWPPKNEKEFSASVTFFLGKVKRRTDNGTDYNKKETTQESRLYAFRSKFPMDDKAFDCLSSSSATVQDQVMNDFWPPKNEREFSASVIFFIGMVKRRMDGTDYNQKETPQESRLYAFRSKFPMDDKAFDYLFSSSATVQDQVMNDFWPPKNEREFSASVTSFLGRVRRRMEQG